MCQNLLLSKGRIIFHCMFIPHFSYQFNARTLALLPHFTYCEQRCYSATQSLVIVFRAYWDNPRWSSQIQNPKINCICNNPLSKSGTIYGFWELGYEPIFLGGGSFFFYYILLSSFLASHGLFSSCCEWGSNLHCASGASHWGGLSCCIARAPGGVDFSSWGERAQLLPDMWNLPRSGKGSNLCLHWPGRF